MTDPWYFERDAGGLTVAVFRQREAAERVDAERFLRSEESDALVELTCDVLADDGEMEAVVAAIASRARPKLQKLRLRVADYDPYNEDYEPVTMVTAATTQALCASTPALLALEVVGNWVLPELHHDGVRVLRARGCLAIEYCGANDGMDGRGVRLPNAEVAALRIEMPTSDGFEASALNVDADVFGSLRSLDLRGSDFYTYRETLLSAVGKLSSAGNLRFLGLPRLDDDDRRRLKPAAAALSSLAQLAVDELEGITGKSVKKHFPKLQIGRPVKSPAVKPSAERAPLAESPADDWRTRAEERIDALMPDADAARELVALVLDDVGELAAYTRERVDASEDTSREGLPPGAVAALGRTADPIDTEALFGPIPEHTEAPFLGRLHDATATAVVPDRDEIVVGREDGSVALRRASDLERIFELVGLGGEVVWVAVSHDGRMAAAGDADRTLTFDLEHARPAAQLRRLRHARFTEDGALRGDGHAFEPQTGRELRDPARMTRVDSVAFSPDGSRLVTAPDVTVWDLARVTPLFHIGVAGETGTRVVHSPDGACIATVVDQHVRLYDMEGNEIRTLTPVPESSHVCLDVAFAPNGDVITGMNHRLSRFTPDGKKVWSRSIGKVWTDRIAVSPDGRFVATGSYAAQVALVDAETGKRIAELTWRFDPPRERAVTWAGGEGLLFNADSTEVMTSGLGLKRWRVPSGDQLEPIAAGYGPITLSPSGRTLALRGGGGIELRPANELARVEKAWPVPGDHVIRDLAFSRDERLLATCGWDNRVYVWDLAKVPDDKPAEDALTRAKRKIAGR